MNRLIYWLLEGTGKISGGECSPHTS